MNAFTAKNLGRNAGIILLSFAGSLLAGWAIRCGLPRTIMDPLVFATVGVATAVAVSFAIRRSLWALLVIPAVAFGLVQGEQWAGLVVECVDGFGCH